MSAAQPSPRAPPPLLLLLPPPKHTFTATAPRQAHKFTDDKELYVGADLWHEDKEAAFARYGPMSDWDVSDITSMRCLFGGDGRERPHFNEDLSRWNVSRVTDMYCAFNGATAFTGAGIGCWDVSSVTDMCGMLLGATAFNAPIGDWDVSSVTNMEDMLWGATSFNQQLGGQWATSTATKYAMFDSGCPGSIVGKTNNQQGTPEYATCGDGTEATT